MNRTIKRLQSDVQLKPKQNDKFVSFINRYRSNSRTRKSAHLEGSTEESKSRDRQKIRNKRKALKDIMMSNSSSYEDSVTEYIAESSEKEKVIRREDVFSLMNIIGPKPHLLNQSTESNIDMSKTMNKSIKKLHSSNDLRKSKQVYNKSRCLYTVN